MPYSMIVLDAAATKNGTKKVNGVDCDVYHHARPFKKSGNFIQPKEDMYWYVDTAKNELVQSECVIAKQKEYPQDTAAYHDYTASGKYTTDVPESTFEPPKGYKCQ